MTTVAVEQLARRILRLPHPILLAFDVDGTLAPIVDNPADARVPPQAAKDLRRLARSPGTHVALLTGRDPASLRELVKVPGAYRGFEHGQLIAQPGSRVSAPKPPPELARALERFGTWARKEAVPQGARLETKLCGQALHVRELQRRSPKKAQRLLDEASLQIEELGLHLQKGRAVVEAAMGNPDKGKALGVIKKQCRARSVFFVGDDITDIMAIRQAAVLGGIGAFVISKERPRKPSGVSDGLSGPTQVHELLGLLAAGLASGAR